MAVPVLAVMACSSATERETFPDGENSSGSAAQTGSDNSSGGIIGNSDDAGSAKPAGDDAIDLNAVASCDDNLNVDGEAADFLKAIGLCNTTTQDGTAWGVISAKFTDEVGSSSSLQNDEQHGILTKFGDVLTPREGKSLGVLSTGYAREFDSDGSSQTPFTPGQPWGSGGIFGGGDENDVAVLSVKIRVPSNAKSFSFDFNFHSSEWPNYIGSDYNDTFVANLNGENISFDANNKPVSVNLGFFDRCVPDVTTGCAGDDSTQTSVCGGGPDELSGTGFGLKGSGCGGGNSVTKGGATGWLTTQSPVTPGDIITLEFAIWDAGDGAWDSSVLIDNFKWDADEVTVGTGRPVN